MIWGRGIVRNIKETKRKVEQLGGKFKNYYSFKDIIFVPKIGRIDLNKKFIRLRVYKVNNWPTKDVILVRKIIQWKAKSKFEDFVLKKEFTTTKEALNFIKAHFKNKLKRSFEYFREGWEYHLGKKRIFIENIKDFKPTVEIEASDERELKNIFQKLGVIERLTDSVPKIMNTLFQNKP